MNVYIIKDNVSEDKSPLFVCANHSAATRQFAQFLQGVPWSLSNFDLYSLAYFDSDEMRLESLGGPNHIINGAAVDPKYYPNTKTEVTDNG